MRVVVTVKQICLHGSFAAIFGGMLSRRWELEVPVWLILDYDYVVFLAQGVDFLATLDGGCAASGVLAEAVLIVSIGCLLATEIGKTYVTVYIK